MSLFTRYLRIRITAADPESELTKLTAANAELLDVNRIDLLTVEIRVKKSQLSALQSVLQKDGIDYRILRTEGLLWNLMGMGKRPVLLVGLLVFISLACILPKHVFFIKVTGNELVSDRVILQQAENCGIKFGAKASEVRSENVKNYLLGKLPKLQWLGVTTSGCVATIHVKERSDPPEQPNQTHGVSCIVAAQDGIITEMNILRGTSLVRTGQSVKLGDTLVSGYTDCGLKITAQGAEGEVFAHTLRKISVVAPILLSKRDAAIREHTCYRLHIGKKVINLCNHSGIQDATCVKMYSEDYWTLPGGFELPVSLIKTKCVFYANSTAINDEIESDWIARYAREYLRSQMVAGEVLNESLIWNMSDGYCELSGNYACHEMIGQVKCEETIEQYAEDN